MWETRRRKAWAVLIGRASRANYKRKARRRHDVRGSQLRSTSNWACLAIRFSRTRPGACKRIHMRLVADPLMLGLGGIKKIASHWDYKKQPLQRFLWRYANARRPSLQYVCCHITAQPLKVTYASLLTHAGRTQRAKGASSPKPRVSCVTRSPRGPWNINHATRVL